MALRSPSVEAVSKMPLEEDGSKNCALKGIDYAANGVRAEGDAIVMNRSERHIPQRRPESVSAGCRAQGLRTLQDAQYGDRM